MHMRHVERRAREAAAELRGLVVMGMKGMADITGMWSGVCGRQRRSSVVSSSRRRKGWQTRSRRPRCPRGTRSGAREALAELHGLGVMGTNGTQAEKKMRELSVEIRDR
jgi:hypothetical protein